MSSQFPEILSIADGVQVGLLPRGCCPSTYDPVSPVRRMTIYTPSPDCERHLAQPLSTDVFGLSIGTGINKDLSRWGLALVARKC
ncbi:hypothetical protein ES702_00197 [subsurface metagenome]